MLTSYARFVVRHSYLFLLTVSVISTTLTVIPLFCHEIPSFTDPIAGFETRGTTLAHRFIAWENLIDETRPSRRLAADPKEIEDQIRMKQTYQNRFKNKPKNERVLNKKKRKKKKTGNGTIGIEKFWLDSTEVDSASSHPHWGYGRNVSDEDENTELLRNYTRKQWVTLKELHRDSINPSISNYASGMCGAPMNNYAHLVVANTANTSLLAYDNVKNMCKFQSLLLHMGGDVYHKMCQRATSMEELCCPLWSVPNYIAIMSGKDTCENLTREDVNNSILVLKQCASYFHNLSLMASCELGRCRVPIFCSQYDAVYNLLFYMIDSEAFSPTHNSNDFVKNAMIFFPLPRSSTVMPYYKKLQSSNLAYETLVVPAIDFGLKNSLFELWIIEDTWLIGLGGIFVFLCVWIYTRSFLLTLLLFTAITFSLGVAYFVYVYVFNLRFFPFMNLLVIVVVIGIGADDAFIYMKVWKMISKQLIKDNVVNEENGLGELKNMSSAGETILVQILKETLKHSIVTIFFTTLTTCIAFFASYVSYIPAINCFSVFAGTAVLVNFFLMVTWLPAAVFVIDVRMCKLNRKMLDVVYKRIHEMWDEIKVILNRFIITCVTKLHIVFVLVLGAIGIYSIVVVFYFPGLRLPDSKQFQLFQTSHPFEQYDLYYKDKFLFERFGRDIGVGSKMPLRWIWGIKAIDNGNHMNPGSMGELIFQDDFTISDPKSQVWLLGFCARLRAQPFYQQTIGILLPNCFIESFKMYMNRKCVDSMDNIDRTPCCETSTFPYKKEVFDFCIINAMKSLYQTPRELFIPGVAGPKFLRSATPPKVVAVVVEFESVVPYSMSYTAMNNFFQQVENWTQHELEKAPPGMKCGWFLSDFQFYDLQQTLASGTVIALFLSATLGFLVLIPATLSLVIGICSLSSIIFSATVTIATLVLLGWKLNVLESVAISTSAGLAVDFSLHYALSYTNAAGTKATRVKYSLFSSAGPTVAAALTTGFAGIFLLRSNILPYTQIGTFLALIMVVSWTYATFFLCSMLYIFGKDSKVLTSDEIKSASRVSSVCSGVPNLESHELEQLADSSRTNITRSHSPSSMSATTMVLHDEFDSAQNKTESKSNNLANV